MKEQQLPIYEDLLWPTLRALDDRGGSASIHELSEHIASELALSDEILDVPHKDGPQTEVDYRAAWARTHLKLIGAADNTSRGVWTITSVGRGVQSEKQLREKVRQVRKKRAQERRHRKSVPGDDEEVREDQGWEDALLQIIRRMKPDAFERLCQRILRESGFTKVEVTGRSGDGGIDGAGVLRVNLISFHVRFQCKRYTGSVGAREIRDFRGAMIGRADKGLFITTGRFTKDAEHEAVRDGAPAIDLIGGIDLCNLLRSLDLGVSTETVKVMKPKPEFFEGL
ncbi:MAG: restriction endonuclease [Acidobacteriia bacterium]|nr:restriction endonuclease [Terriglobia bacterium]